MLLVSWLRRLSRLRRQSTGRLQASPRLRVMRLEHRRVLNASPLVPLHDPAAFADTGDSARGVQIDQDGAVTIDAGRFADDGIADFFHVYRSDDRIAVSLNGDDVFTARADDVASLTIEGSSDADHLQVDFGPAGTALGAIRFDGDDGTASDTMTLRGTATTVDHALHGDGGGTVAAAGLSIDYDGVEVLRDAVSTAHRNLNLEQTELARLSTDDHGLSLETDGGLLLLDESDHLTIDLDGGGANRFELAGGGEFDAGLAIAGDDADRVVLSGRLDLGDEDLSVSAGAIDVSGAIHTDGGELRLHATSELTIGPAGVLDSDGGTIELNAGADGILTVAGRVDVSDDDGIGGEARLLGHTVRLTGEAQIDGDGRLGGGVILVGGDYQGSNAAVLNALRTTIDRGVTLSADAIDSGDGGRIIVWSDGATHFAGAVLARGGRNGGDGGFAEVSGKELLAFLGTVDLSAAQGDGGTLLLDPKTITVVATAPDLNGDGTTGDDLASPGDLDEAADQSGVDSIITADAIEAILTGGQSLILTATDRIDVDSAIAVTSGTSGLTLIAGVVSIDAGIAIGGTFEVRANNLHIDDSIEISAGTVDAPGIIILSTNTDGAAINLGGADDPGAGGSGNGAVLGLTNAELATLNAGTVRIGSSTAGAITLTADVVSPAAVLELVSAGTIETATPALPADPVPHLTASALLVTAGGNVRLDGDNAVGSLAGSSSTSGATFEFVSGSGELSIATVSGVSGIQTNAGTISLSSGGDLAIDQNLVSGGQAITLSAAGMIDLDGAAEIDADTASVTVIDGTLGGAGTITGNLVIAAGATISPGGSNSGTLTVNGDLTLAAGSTYAVNIDDDRANPPDAPIAGTDYDQIVVTGATTIETGAILNLVSTGSTEINPADRYTLIASGGSLTGTFTGHPDAFVLTDFGGPDVDAVVSYAAGDVVVQVVGPVNFAAPDDDAANNLRIVRNGALVEFYVDGELMGTSVLAATESITVTGADGEDDSLTIDFSGGVFGLSVTFDGGAGGNDALILTGGIFDTVAHTFESANDGRTDLAGLGVAESVVYSGLEPIVDNLSAVNRVFTFNGGSETITVSDAAAAGETTIDSTLGESVTFVNPTTSLTINAGDGDDVIDVASIDAAYHASLTIDAGDGDDEIHVSTALTLGSLVAAGHLDVTGEIIELGANINTDGGATGGDVTLTGAVSLAADVSIDTDVAAGTDGTITFAGTVDADLEANNRALAVTAGGGDVAFQAAVGSVERLNTLTISSANNTTFVSTVHFLGDLTQSAGTGTTTFRGGTIGGNLAATTGAVEFVAGTTAVAGSATILAATAIAGGTADGVADLSAASIDLTVTSGTIGESGTPLEVATTGNVDADTAAGNGDVFLTAIGDLRLGLIDAGTGDATLAATGAIVDALAGDGAGVENIRAATVDLTAASGIGASDAIDTAASTLRAVNTTSGDLQIAETTSVSIALLAQRRDQPADAIPDGSISLTAGGAITIAGLGVFTEGLGEIDVAATADLTVNAAVVAGSDSATEASAVDSTNVVLSAGQDVAVNSAVTAEQNVTITAGRNLVLAAAVTAGASGTTSGSMRLDAGRSVGVTAVGSAVADDDVTILAGTGSISLGGNVTAGTSSSVRLVANTTVNQTGGAISAEELGVISGGDATLLSTTNDVDVFAGTSATGSLAFADADGFTLDSVIANADFAGASGAVATGGNVLLRTETGALNLDADVTASPTGTIRLSSGESIDQISGTISGENLGAIATAAITLTSSTNDVDVFAASAGGAASFRDVDAFSTGTVGASTGFIGVIGVTGHDVTLRAETGDLNLATAVVADAASGVVRLSAEQGAVNQTGGGITGFALGVRAGAPGITLTNAANNVSQFAAVSDGAILYRDASGFTVGTITANGLFAATSGAQSSAADVTLRAGTGQLTLDADVSTIATGTVRLTSAAGILQSSGTITASMLGVRAAGNVSLLSSGNDVDTFAANNTGVGAEVAYRDADELTIGSVTASSQFSGATGISTAGGDVLLVTSLGGVVGDGSLTISEAIAAGGGTVRI
ncbi:MAG: hypothetical protein WBC44_18100, partial [Planctomycetaceae bacterium]